MISLILLSVIVFLATYLYYKTITGYKYWEKKGIRFVKPKLIFGNIGECVFRQKSVPTIYEDIYEEGKDVRYIGCFQCHIPTLFVKDPDLIKQITVKDFDSFSDHNLDGSKEVDPLWANNLLVLKANGSWQKSRAKLTSTFSASKLKTMVPFIQRSANNFINTLGSTQDVQSIELKEIFRKIANDTIASVAFGIEIDSFKDTANKFFTLGKAASDFTGLRGLIFFGYSLFPNLMKFFRIRLVNNEVGDFFRNLIRESIQVRKQQNIVRPDFIHLLTTEPTLENKLQFTLDEVTAHSVLFFLAGYESISSALAEGAYELALNPDVQEKVYQEVLDTIEYCGGKNLTYDDAAEMKYLDMVVSEILRLHPPNAAIDRKSTKTYTIEPVHPDEKPLVIDKNTNIWIPVQCIQSDPRYFTNPHKFDPERFNSENKKNIKPCTYIPFGNGPRNCIASRFAILQIKIVLIELLKNYEFVCTEKTEIPLTYKPESFLMIPKNGIWIGMKSRN